MLISSFGVRQSSRVKRYLGFQRARREKHMALGKAATACLEQRLSMSFRSHYTSCNGNALLRRVVLCVCGLFLFLCRSFDTSLAFQSTPLCDCQVCRSVSSPSLSPEPTTHHTHTALSVRTQHDGHPLDISSHPFGLQASKKLSDTPD